MKCLFCNHELIWSCDYDFEDYGLEEDGIVAVLHCPNCDAMWEGYLSYENNENIGNNE